MCNVAKLKGKIIEKGLNQVMLAKAAGMDRSTLSRKMKNGEAFTIGEANKIVTILHLSKDEAAEIFLQT